MEHYKTLGIKNTQVLDLETLKKAYKKQARLWHPDLNLENIEEAEREFKKVQAAYSELLFVLKKNAGELPANMLDPKEFFRHIGFDDLVGLTQETIVEINLERAARGLSFEGSGGATEMINAKLMQKMRLWARGPDYQSGFSVIDSQGHFTDKAIRNILEYAILYEKADTIEKKRRFSDMEDEDYERDAAASIRLSTLIRTWIESHYVRIQKFGWTHKTKLIKWQEQVKAEIPTILKKLSVDDETTLMVSAAVESGRFKSAQAILSSLLSDGAKDRATRSSSEKDAAKKREDKITAELKKLSVKIGVSLDDLPSKLASEKEVESNLVLSMLAPRLRSLLDERDSLRAQKGGASGAKDDVLNSLISDIKELSVVVEKAC